MAGNGVAFVHVEAGQPGRRDAFLFKAMYLRSNLTIPVTFYRAASIVTRIKITAQANLLLDFPSKICSNRRTSLTFFRPGFYLRVVGERKSDVIEATRITRSVAYQRMEICVRRLMEWAALMGGARNSFRFWVQFRLQFNPLFSAWTLRCDANCLRRIYSSALWMDITDETSIMNMKGYWLFDQFGGWIYFANY